MTSSRRAKVNAKNGGNSTSGFGVAFSTVQEETPAPVTVAMGGRGSSGARREKFIQKFQLGNALTVGVADS